MVTDPLFYRLFATSPETFFLLLGMPAEVARGMAAQYEFQAIEFKETSHRTDGVFLPKDASLPIYFLEVQFYSLPSVFADLLAKAFTYLKQHDPMQTFRGIVLFASRTLKPVNTAPYQAFLDAGVVECFYLDELPKVPNAPLGVSILHLIGQSDQQAAESGRELVVRAKAEIVDVALRTDLLELIQTVIFYKLANATREEIQDMLQVHDIRQTRVYQEAMEEGREEGREEGEKRKAALAIVNLAEKKMPAEEIAAVLAVEVAFVQEVLQGRSRG